MAEQTFTIDIVIDPAPAATGAARVEQSLERLRISSSSLDRSLDRALDIRSQAAGAATGLQTLRATISLTADQAARMRGALSDGLAEVERRARPAANAVDTLRQALALGGVVAVGRELLQTADAYTNLQNRIRTVVTGQRELIETTDDLLGIANRTRSSLQGTTELYARVALSARELGRSQAELLQFTESLNQAIILSGASAQEASAGLIQLSQGIASGTLRGDELRSVLEQLPAVADVIAKQLGVTRGELRKLGEEGKISATAVLDAFASARQELQERFANAVPTLSQSFQVLQNNLVATIGQLDQTAGATELLSRGVLVLAGNMNVLAIAGAAAGAAVTTSLVRQALPLLTSGLRGVFNPFGLLVTGATAAGVAVVQLTQYVEETGRVLERTQGDLTAFGQLGDRILNRTREIARLQSVLAKAPDNQVAAERLAAAQRELAALRGESDRYVASARQVEQQNARASESFADLNRSLERERELLGLGNVEREVRERLFKAEDAFAKNKVQLVGSLRAEVEERIRANVALREEETVINRILGPQQQLVREQEILARALANGRISTDQFNDAMAQLSPRIEKAEKQLDPLVARLRDLQEANDQLRATLRPFGALEGQARNIETDVGRQRGRPVTADEGAALRDLLAQNALLAEQARIYEEIVGPIEDYERAFAAANAQVQLTPGLVEQLQRTVDVARIRMLEASTDLGAGFERAFLKAKLEAQDFAAVAERTVGVFANAAEDALVEFATTGKLSFADLARGILADLTRIIARLLVVQALSAFSGGGTGAVGAGANLLGGARARGGTTQPGKSYIVGDGGEPELFTPGRTGAITPMSQLGGGARPVVNLQLVNVTDPKEVQGVLNSGNADEAFLNMLSRTADKAKSILGAA